MSNLGVGLLKNDEYKGFFNALKRIYSEEGFISFYRGYSAYMLAVIIEIQFTLLFSDTILDEFIASCHKLYDDELTTNR